MFSEFTFQHLEVFIFIMPLVTVFFIPTAVIFAVRKYYRTQKILFWITAIPAIIMSINVFYVAVAFRGEDIYLFVEDNVVNAFANTMYLLLFLIPIICAYWIHVCSLHKYRDYWILAIITGMPILWLLWLIGTY